MTDTPEIDTGVPPSGDGCAECLAARPTGWWFHLRRCAHCGHVGCCDSSPSQHARAHYQQNGHRYIQSFEPGEEWYWDYQTQDYYDGPQRGLCNFSGACGPPSRRRGRPVGCRRSTRLSGRGRRG